MDISDPSRMQYEQGVGVVALLLKYTRGNALLQPFSKLNFVGLFETA